MARIDRLTPGGRPAGGEMSAAQMLAHCVEVARVSNGKPLTGTPWYIRWMGGLIKRMVLSEKPYPRGARTHPQFGIGPGLSFDEERLRLLSALEAMHSAGRNRGEEAAHPLFGVLSAPMRRAG